MKRRPYLNDHEFHFRVALSLVIIATLVHFASFSLFVSYDGMQYTYLANVLFTPSFPSAWSFLRTPFFPLALRIAFTLAGEQPYSALLVTTLFGLGGILLAGLTVRRIAGGTTGAVALIVLVFYPVLVGYQHVLLTETGTFFWLALLVWSLTAWAKAANRNALLLACWVALVIALGYYWRPTIQYLSPLVALLFILTGLVSPNSSRPYSGLIKNLKNRPLLILGALIVAAGPWMLAYPWLSMTKKYAPGVSEITVAHGMYKQVLVPPDDPVVGPLRDQYEAAVKQDSKHGKLPLDGLSIVGRMELLGKIADEFHHAGLMRLILKYPLRYSRGVLKSMIFFLGVPDHRLDNENWHFSRVVFTTWPTDQSLDRAPGWDRSAIQFPTVPYSGGATLGRMFMRLLSFYPWLVLLSSLASVGWFAFSLVRGNPVVLTITAVPLAFLLLHALTMMSAARYGFPVYPMMLANSVLFIGLAFQKYSRKRSKLRTDRSDSPVANEVLIEPRERPNSPIVKRAPQENNEDVALY
jgi:4-amino-4-deoxy-L-arabinose transferase-like glycosyltransferase